MQKNGWLSLGHLRFLAKDTLPQAWGGTTDREPDRKLQFDFGRACDGRLWSCVLPLSALDPETGPGTAVEDHCATKTSRCKG
jgi:hypothetical protein